MQRGWPVGKGQQLPGPSWAAAPTKGGGAWVGGDEAQYRAAEAGDGEQDCPERDLFEVIDQDADGVISPQDFYRFRDGYCNRSDPTGGTLFSFLDRDGDGVVNPADFRQFFQSADVCQDGFITRNEFAHYEQVVAPICRGEPHWRCPHTQLVDCSSRHRGGLDTEEEILELIDGLLEGFRAVAAEEAAMAEGGPAVAAAAMPAAGHSSAAGTWEAPQGAPEAWRSPRPRGATTDASWTWPAARDVSPDFGEGDIVTWASERSEGEYYGGYGGASRPFAATE